MTETPGDGFGEFPDRHRARPRNQERFPDDSIRLQRFDKSAGDIAHKNRIE